MGGGRSYRVQEFAKLAGVTVRALHHYDRLGLLKPGRTTGGYRAYFDKDLERLEQIVALKFIGLPLKEIKRVLDRDGLDLSKALRQQRTALAEKKHLLEAAIRAVMAADGELQSGKQPSTCALKKIIEVIEMQSNPDWMMKYFSDEARAKVEARKASWTPDMQARAEQNWSDLFRDIRLALDKDPASMEAQFLVDRWNNLVREFTGGEPGVVKGVKLLYSDRANWPVEFEEKMAPFSDEQVWEFFRKAVAARRRG